MDTIDTLRAELHTVNAERHTLRYTLALKDEENEALLTINDALLTKLTELATQPLHRIVANRVAINTLCATLAMRNNEHVQNFLAVPKFVASQAATAVSGFWAKAPRVRLEW